ncbi:CYFA0S08e01090g1_1 [Cyberlindnera fabianii]|uniref:CYFA0S08e01090g1_1 n=1 Tax=Cyberlindnera fabianii TaxID=36022 RepID=A0A061AW47_CYBFA|nr:Monothiol glutaredoxin-6 [Cyberlindnera fabianii]CDR41878.1 CYFA0S08e01090g1_1 [Cyberlindnera fabianii]
MVSSRKSRILALSAVLLTLVFVMITTHNRSAAGMASFHGNSAKQAATETTTRIGGIDESAIKSNEDKIKQKIQQGKVEQAVNAGATEKELKELRKQQQAEIQHQREQGKPITPGSASTNEADIVFDPAQELQSIMSLSPVVIFSKSYCGYSKALKNLLSSEYELNPAPTIVELDKHKQGRALQDYIAQKTGRKTVPNLLINGISRGGSDEMRKLHDEGKLLAMLNQWGGKSVKATKINAPSNS